MINKKFKDNWLKILSFNKDRDILEDSEKLREQIRIPFSPITINLNLLYYLFEILYPKFINDQQNILDIIIQKVEKKNNIIGLFLYKTRKAGIHESVELLPDKLIKIKSLEIEELDDLFSKIQSALQKEKKIQISSIRIFKKEAIDLINQYCEKVEEISFYEFLNKFLELIQKILEKELFLIYPEPIIFNFLKFWKNLLDEIRLQSLFKLIEDILPEFNLSLLINGNTTKFIVLLQKIYSKSEKSELILKLFTQEELGINLEDPDLKNTLMVIQDKLKTEKVYYLNLDDIISFISDIFELLVPLKKENLKFLFQKALFGYRSFEKHWDMVPKPVIYHNLVRFLIRLIGFNLNLKKISHWAIPETIFNFIDFYFGLNSKILVVISDIRRTKKIKSSQGKILKDSWIHTVLLEFKDSTLDNIKVINKNNLFSDTDTNSFSSIKKTSIEKFGALTAIIVIDKFLLQNIVQNFIFNHAKLSFFPKFKTMKLLKDENYFKIYPDFPFYTFIKKKRSISLLRLTLPIIIDKFEF